MEISEHILTITASGKGAGGRGRAQGQGSCLLVSKGQGRY